MKVAVSNIAWGGHDFPGFLALLKSIGVDGVELAASLLWKEPVTTTPAERNATARMLRDHGLETVGLHALVFTRPDLTLFETAQRRDALGEYLKRTYEVCRDLGGRTLVFGSPKSRKRGALSKPEADKIADEFFRRTADDAKAAGVYLLIEPLAPHETDYIQSSAEGAALVRRVAHPHFRLELDGRAMAESGEDYSAFAAHKDILMHVQTSDPGLREPGAQGLDHAPIGSALRASGYAGFISLEMRRDEKDAAGAITRGAAALKRHYVGGVRA